MADRVGVDRQHPDWPIKSHPHKKLGRLFLTGSSSPFWFLLAASRKLPWITYNCFLAPSSKDGYVLWQTDGPVERMTTIPAMSDVSISLKLLQYLQWYHFCYHLHHDIPYCRRHQYLSRRLPGTGCCSSCSGGLPAGAMPAADGRCAIRRI